MRKVIVGETFLLVSGFLVFTALRQITAPDLVGLSTVIAAMAVGVGAIVYGNVKEHEAKSKEIPSA